ncbi:MAG TPA: D-alanine--D-alanine ligase [Planctomycetaceae bacterium]|nr:D-alanine--D-alanine ligase [Planctomycetaceae bacterium]
MRIGLTFDLRSEYLAAGYTEEQTAEFDRDDTVAAIAGALEQLGHEPDRIGHARRLVERLARGDRWDLVFNICEGLHGIAREAQVPAILDVYEIPYTFSDPLVMALTLHKGLTKTIVAAAGVPTPRFVVVERLSDLDGSDLEFPAFAKPVAEGTGKGVTAASIARDAGSLRPLCAGLLERFRQPVLVEEFLPGREFTVGLTGTADAAQAVGTLEIVLRDAAEPGVYSYVNKERCEDLVTYPRVRADDDAVVREAESIALRAWRALNCRDAGRVDLRCDARGRPQFLEVNPLAGLHPEHSDLPMVFTAAGLPYVSLIERIIHSAAERLP